MKTSTIHRNPTGDVLNECSATGFKFTTSNGKELVVTVENDEVVVTAIGFVGYYDYRNRRTRFVVPSDTVSGKTALGVIVDDKTKTCYECGKPAKWLAPDSRCGDCTRLTADEVRGA